MPRPLIDLTGQTFGRLVVLARARSNGDRTEARWICTCDCGQQSIVPGYKLRRGETTSCGCYREDFRVTHAQSGGNIRARSPEYQSWLSMIQRCTNEKNPRYDDYGGRGITVCDEWRDFTRFRADMGPRPRGRTLDRRDNDGPYTPINCRWATRSEQQKNQRRRQHH